MRPLPESHIINHAQHEKDRRDKVKQRFARDTVPGITVPFELNIKAYLLTLSQTG